MDTAAWTTAGVTLIAFIALASGRIPTDLALLGALAVLLIAGVIPVDVAVSGFGSPAVVTVGALLVVAEAVRRSGLITRLLPLVLAGARQRTAVLARMLPAVALASAFLNNTPVVAVLIADLRSHAREHAIDPRGLLMPLSFAAILGGTLTLIGTSTNLLVAGLAEGAGVNGMHLFTPSLVAIPAVIIGLFLAIVLVPRLLGRKQAYDEPFADSADYTVEAVVDANGPLDGSSLGSSRDANGKPLNPAALIRGDECIPAPAPDRLITAGDRLVFAADAKRAETLLRTPGLSASQRDHQRPVGNDSHLLEVVVGQGCPAIGDRVGDGSFRRRYGAAVLAVSRRGDRVASDGVSGWRLRTGDTLLLEARPDFLTNNHEGDHFFLVSSLGSMPQTTPNGSGQRLIAATLLVAMVLAAATGLVPMTVAALTAALITIGMRLIPASAVHAALDLPVLITIGAAIGLGAALTTTGVAASLAWNVITLAGDHPWLVLVAIAGATMLATEIVTNAAAAALMVPVALASAERLDVAPMPYLVAVMIMASCSFLTPIGYQTNLMVAGPGGYRPLDFMRGGLPITLGVLVTTCTLTPLVFPFTAG